MFDILDVIIGLFFVYLLLSLVCTAVNEYIASILNKRGKELIRGIEGLLEDTNLREAFYKHPLINTIFPDWAEFARREEKVRSRSWWLRGVYRFATWAVSSSNRRLRAPSYLPARSFALALLDVVSRTGGQTQAADVDALIARAEASYPEIARLLEALRREPAADVTEFANLKLTAELLSSQVPVELREKALTGLLATREGVQKLQDSVEVWFNNAMDRVSGIYKRYTQTVLFVIGLGVALVANADTFQLWRRLSTDDKLRDGLATQAVAYFDDALGSTGDRGVGGGGTGGTGGAQGGGGTTGDGTTDGGAGTAGGGTQGGETTGGGPGGGTTGAGTTGGSAAPGGGGTQGGGTTGGGPGGGTTGAGTTGGGGGGQGGTAPTGPDQERAKVVLDSALAALERTDLDLGWTWEEAGRLGIVRPPTGADTANAARRDVARAIRLIHKSDSTALPRDTTRADSVARIRTVLQPRPPRWQAAEIGNWRWGAIFAKLAGILITAFALSLGAPFWFDTLNKFIHIRAAGRAPHEKPVSPEAAGKRPVETATK